MRYYISNRLIRAKDPTAWRLPAKAIEEAIENAIRTHLQNSKKEMTMFVSSDVSMFRKLHDEFSVDELTQSQIFEWIERIDLRPNKISIKFDPNSLAGISETAKESINPAFLTFSQPLRIRKRGVESKIIIGDYETLPNENLVQTLVEAHRWLNELKLGKSTSQIAKANNVEFDYLRKRIGLALLSPKIQKAIIAGKHPDNWSVAMFVKADIPFDWRQQERRFLERPINP